MFKLSPLIVFLMLVGAVQGQTKSDLNGTWKMDPAKCEFGSGPAPVPERRTDRISYHEPNLKDTITQMRRGQETTYDMNYLTDGTETNNAVPNGDVKSTAHWEGDTLAIDTKGKIGGHSVTFKDRWTLAPDGKTLILHRRLGTFFGETLQKIVFDRQ
jgi:hypothetical protein